MDGMRPWVIKLYIKVYIPAAGAEGESNKTWGLIGLNFGRTTALS